jgi:hypothetical protein
LYLQDQAVREEISDIFFCHILPQIAMENINDKLRSFKSDELLQVTVSNRRGFIRQENRFMTA